VPSGGTVYRAPGLLAPSAGAPGGTGSSRAEFVPQELAGRFSALTGLDVSGIRIHRGPTVSQAARGWQARAFTRGGEIFLPDEAGPLEQTSTRGLLAHELAHVVQQRTLAPSLPDEGSPDGAALEDEAARAEQWYLSGGSSPLPRLAHLPVAALLAARASGAGPAVASELAGATSAGVQRLPLGQLLGGGLHGDGLHGVGLHGVGPHGDSLHGGSAAPPDPDPGSAPSLPGPATASSGGEPAGPSPVSDDGAGDRPGMDGLARLVAEVAADEASREALRELLANASRLTELCGERPPDLDDPVSLDELSTKVYRRLRGLLRSELLVDRERAGLLADIG